MWISLLPLTSRLRLSPVPMPAAVQIYQGLEIPHRLAMVLHQIMAVHLMMIIRVISLVVHNMEQVVQMVPVIPAIPAGRYMAAPAVVLPGISPIRIPAQVVQVQVVQAQVV